MRKSGIAESRDTGIPNGGRAIKSPIIEERETRDFAGLALEMLGGIAPRSGQFGAKHIFCGIPQGTGHAKGFKSF